MLEFDKATQDLIWKVTLGVDFRVIHSDTSGTFPFAPFVHAIRGTIADSPDRTNLGGESVLSSMHADTVFGSSLHLLHWNGSQAMHFHPGPRILTIVSNKPWFVTLGGSGHAELAKEGPIPVVKVAFPGSAITLLRYRRNAIHGFEGEDFAAISVHHSDLEEIEALDYFEQDTLQQKSNDRDIMGTLTRVLDDDDIKHILAEPISCHTITELRKERATPTRRRRDVRTSQH